MKTAVCVASGPSLTAEDCDRAATVADWMIACNESWRVATWAHAIYAGDFRWWEIHHHEVPSRLERWTCSATAAHRYRLNFHHAPQKVYNSGQRAIQLCIEKGYERIILLGYDCSVKNGTHWHGDHPKNKNPDQQAVDRWQDHFASIDVGGVDVINCSRETELRAFRRMTLENAIAL